VDGEVGRLQQDPGPRIGEQQPGGAVQANAGGRKELDGRRRAVGVNVATRWPPANADPAGTVASADRRARAGLRL